MRVVDTSLCLKIDLSIVLFVWSAALYGCDCVTSVFCVLFTGVVPPHVPWMAPGLDAALTGGVHHPSSGPCGTSITYPETVRGFHRGQML